MDVVNEELVQIQPAGEWFDAETYHQKCTLRSQLLPFTTDTASSDLDLNPGGYECPSKLLFRSFATTEADSPSQLISSTGDP